MILLFHTIHFFQLQGLCAQTFYGHMHSVNSVTFNLKVSEQDLWPLEAWYIRPDEVTVTTCSVHVYGDLIEKILNSLCIKDTHLSRK